MALVGGMAGWHRVGPLRDLVLIPVTIRDESRRWEADAAGGDGGARQQGSRSHVVMKNWTASLQTERVAAEHHKDLPRYPAGARAGAAPD